MAFMPPNYTQIPNEFFDVLVPTLKEGEIRMILTIMRQTFGYHKQWDRISFSQLEKMTGMKRKAVNNSLKSLVSKKLILKHKVGEKGEEQCWYCLNVKKDEEGDQNEPDPIEDSNNFYQCSKKPLPSVLKRPTKETLTKEIKENKTKESVPSADATTLCSFLLNQIKKRKENFTRIVNPHWIRNAEKLVKLRSIKDLERIILYALDDSFWGSKILTPEKLLNHLDTLEMQMSRNKKFAPKEEVEREVLILKNTDFLKKIKDLMEKKFSDLLERLLVTFNSNSVTFNTGKSPENPRGSYFSIGVGEKNFIEEVTKKFREFNILLDDFG